MDPRALDSALEESATPRSERQHKQREQRQAGRWFRKTYIFLK